MKICIDCNKEYESTNDSPVCYDCWSQDVDSCFPQSKISKMDIFWWGVFLILLIITTAAYCK